MRALVEAAVAEEVQELPEPAVEGADAPVVERAGDLGGVGVVASSSRAWPGPDLLPPVLLGEALEPLAEGAGPCVGEARRRGSGGTRTGRGPRRCARRGRRAPPGRRSTRGPGRPSRGRASPSRCRRSSKPWSKPMRGSRVAPPVKAPVTSRSCREGLRQGRDPRREVGDGPLALQRLAQGAVASGHAVSGGREAGQEAEVRGSGPGRGGEVDLEEHRLPGQGVDARARRAGVVAVGPQPVRAQGVGGDQDHVRAASGSAVQPGPATPSEGHRARRSPRLARVRGPTLTG